MIQSKKRINYCTKVFLFIYLFTILSGALRKWIISSKEVGNFILFLQILVPYTFILVKGGLKKWQIGQPALILLIVVMMIGIINPLNLTINHGILGLLLHGSFYFILFFYVNNRGSFEFEKIMPFLVIASLSHLILVFYQYTQPSDSFINTYADIEAVGSIAIVGKSARVTGMFSYISGFTGFLFFHSLLVWALIKSRYKSIYTLSLLLMGLIACFMSGARAATYLYLLIAFAIVFNEYFSFRKIIFDFKLFLPILVFATVLLGFGSDKFSEIISNAFTGFIERRALGVSSGEETSRILGDFFELKNFRGNYPVFGVGLGSTYQGATRLFGVSPYVLEYGFFESELIRILLEGGFLLLGARIAVTIFLINQMFIPKSGKFILIVVLLLFFPVVFNVYNATFAGLGIILLDRFYYKEWIQKCRFDKMQKGISSA
jgi:hypothetical protein